jgi:NADPH-dependent glutamate synthase beta subunit-like oxidoreductase/Pyruvate/2-oxoacid:ferredoxin oxidoreductase delta subunit
MGLLKKTTKKPLKITGRGAGSAVGSNLRPQQVTKLPPCVGECPSANDIRGWITRIAQREKLGLSKEEAFDRAWQTIVETNPFPAIMGRVCPHPCETKCNREGKDGAVAINAMERFIGDWGLERKLKLQKLDGAEPKSESVGVIGGGPAGLSFAYQMARRGYPVTVYEQFDRAGGMLLWGIPVYRLPRDVLQAEIDRILELGVELRLSTQVGKDISVEELKQQHQLIFMGIGAHKGRLMKVEGEEGPGVWTGTDYLNRVNGGEKVDVGQRVAVIGGGDTAVDAARVARRTGAEVTILYRRTRKEMPAIDTEVEDSFKEGIKIEFLVAPVGVKRAADQKLEAVVVQKMELGEPDSSGRRRPVPIEGSEYEVPIDGLIAAISQEPDYSPIPELGPEKRWLEADKHGKVRDKLYAGGDVLNLGIATTAVLHGRLSAEAANAELRGQPAPNPGTPPAIALNRIKLEFYEEKPKAQQAQRPVSEWLSQPEAEINRGITEAQLLEECKRCFSCGECFGCERCWMYCTPGCFAKVPQITEGRYYTIKLDTCDGCKKCADECPCGYLDMI